MRKILFLLASFLLTTLVIIIFIFIPRPPTQNTATISPFPSTSPAIPRSSKLNISNIEVDNFYPDAERIDNQKNVYIVDDRNRYQIIYEEQFDQFLISILTAPFEELRVEAEQKLIKELGITEADACFLNIVVTTPAFANPDFSGKPYRPSFCE